MNQKKTTLIVDLDNTLYDWVEQWYQSFNAMLNDVQRISDIPREQLIREIKKVHEQYGTSEYAFLLEELPSLKNKHPDGNIQDIYSDAIRDYRIKRKEYLKLYPTVLQTLARIKSLGVKIVAYTESLAFYSSYRIRYLGLDGIIDILYSPEDHDLPENLTSEQIRKYPATSYEFQATIHRHTPKGVLKPSSEVLGKILQDLQVTTGECIYVGDSLMKDVAMANELGITSVHAKYGEAHTKESQQDAYGLLREVTHWSASSVEKEKKSFDIKPDIVLANSFSELIPLFDFSSENTDSKEQQLEIWNKVVDVQMHFNELCLKVRGFAVTVVAAILSVLGFAIKERIADPTNSSPYLMPYLLFVGLITWIAFWLMDQLWYHRLLKGAVAQGVKIEKNLRWVFPGIDLATSIGEASALKILNIKLKSDRRLFLFYAIVAVLLFIPLAYFSYQAFIADKVSGTMFHISEAPNCSSPTPCPRLESTGYECLWQRQSG